MRAFLWLFVAICVVFLLASTAPEVAWAAISSGTLIVLNKSEANASLISLATGKEVERIPTGDGPHEVAVSPDGRTAVVANYGAQNPGSSLTVIDIPNRKSVKTIDLKKYHRPHGIVYMPDGKHVVLTAEQEKVVLVVEIESGKLRKSVSTGQHVSHMLALTPDSKRAFVANIGSGSVTVIDLGRGKHLKDISTAAGTEGIDISPDGAEVWVSNRAADNVSIIDTRSLKVLETIECQAFPIRVKFTPNGKHVLVSNAKSGDVSIFDAQTRREIKRISMSATAVELKEDRLFGDSFGDSPVPVGVLVDPEGRFAYVANTNADMLTVIDLESWQIKGRLKAGRQPDGMAYSPIELLNK